MAGTAGLDPQTANLRFDLRGLEILPFQPYFADQVALTVTSGELSAKGQIGLSTPKGKGGRRRRRRRSIWTGTSAVTNLAVVDNQRQEPLVAWRGFRLDGLRVSNHPLSSPSTRSPRTISMPDW